MFCRNCGAKMSDNARFCSECGNARIEEHGEIIEDNAIRLKIIPEFNVQYKLLCNIGRAILYVFAMCLGFKDLYKLWFVYPSVLLITIGIVLIYIIIKMIFEKLQYNDMEYDFYNTKIEYKNGFLNKEEKELKYKYIREVVMSQNILERFFHIGTIRIFTNASSGRYNRGSHNTMRGRNGIYIHCVNNVKEQYRIIKQIIDEGIL